MNELLKWNDFLKYSSFIGRQIVTESVSNPTTSSEPSDEVKKKAARIKVEYASQLLANKFPFFSEILFSLQVIYTYDSRIPTAATDGVRIFINPNFFFPMNQKEVMFVLCHEVMHVALFHVYRMYNRDRYKWNIAGDHEINLLLASEGILSMADITGNRLNGYANEKYKGMSAEVIYNTELEQQKPEEQPKDSKPDPNKGDTPDQDKSKKPEPGDSGGTPQPEGEPGGTPQPGNGEPGGTPQPGNGEPGGTPKPGKEEQPSSAGNDEPAEENHPITVIRGPKTGEVIPKEVGDSIAKDEGIEGDGVESQGSREPSEDDIKRSVRGAAQRHLSERSKDKGSGNNGDIYQRIMELTEPIVNWRQELARFIGKIASKSDFKFPNRRFVASGKYRYGLKDEENALAKAGLALDVSGSIMSSFPDLVSEVAGIVKAKKVKEVHVIPFADTVVTPFVMKGFKKPTPDDFAKIKTGGGSEAIPKVVEYIDANIRKPDFVVIMTDGYLTHGVPETAPAWGKKIIWLIFDNPKFEVSPNWGKVIHANQDKGYYGK